MTSVNKESNIFSRILKLSIFGFDLYQIFSKTRDFRTDVSFSAKIFDFFEAKKLISKDPENLSDSAKELYGVLDSFPVQILRLKKIRGNRKRAKLIESLKQRTILIPFVLSNAAAKLQLVQHELPYTI